MPTGKTLLLVPFRALGAEQTFGMLLHKPIVDIRLELKKATAMDEILRAADYYFDEYPRQINRAGYCASPQFNVPSNFWMDALNGGGPFFIEKPIRLVGSNDIPDSPLGLSMEKVASLIIATTSPDGNMQISTTTLPHAPHLSFAERVLIGTKISTDQEMPQRRVLLVADQMEKANEPQFTH